MHRRYERTNIPIEIVRTVVEIAEVGNFTKAGERLALSQPAISAQIKRIQALVGAPIFERTASGLKPTPKGLLVIAQARQILASNDQILSLGGAVRDMRSFRIGLSNLYAEQFCGIWRRHQHGVAEPVTVHCDESDALRRMLADEHVDVTCMLGPTSDTVLSWEEPFVWARSPQFVLSPGAQIPLVSLAQDFSSSPAVDSLEAAGLGYRLVFESPDFYARLAAVREGIGIMVLPARQVPPSLVIAKEYYLPRIKPLVAGICVRNNARGATANRLVEVLGELRGDIPIRPSRDEVA